MNATWEEKRAYNAQPGRKHHEQVDMTVFQQETVYTDVFQEGDVQEINSFLREQGFDPAAWPDDVARQDFAEKDSAIVFTGSTF